MGGRGSADIAFIKEKESIELPGRGKGKAIKEKRKTDEGSRYNGRRGSHSKYLE